MTFDPVFRRMEDEPMEALVARVALIQAEAERLAQYLATLSPDAWRQPSACPGWEVRDVVARLVEVAQFYVRTMKNIPQFPHCCSCGGYTAVV